MEEWVHRQNLIRFQSLLAQCKDENQRALLLTLLAEEQAKYQDHSGGILSQARSPP